jgi:hypothetical protein
VTGSLIVLEWTCIGGCVLMAAVVAGAFLASLAGELRRYPAALGPGGPWYPRTPGPATRPLALGMSAAAVEAEIRELAHGRERPA